MESPNGRRDAALGTVPKAPYPTRVRNNLIAPLPTNNASGMPSRFTVSLELPLTCFHTSSKRTLKGEKGGLKMELECELKKRYDRGEKMKEKSTNNNSAPLGFVATLGSMISNKGGTPLESDLHSRIDVELSEMGVNRTRSSKCSSSIQSARVATTLERACFVFLTSQNRT